MSRLRLWLASEDRLTAAAALAVGLPSRQQHLQAVPKHDCSWCPGPNYRKICWKKEMTVNMSSVRTDIVKNRTQIEHVTIKLGSAFTTTSYDSWIKYCLLYAFWYVIWKGIHKAVNLIVVFLAELQETYIERSGSFHTRQSLCFMRLWATFTRLNRTPPPTPYRLLCIHPWWSHRHMPTS